MSLTFGMNSASDCLQEFRNKIDRFSQDDLNGCPAMDCAVAGWSVVDCIFEREGERLGFTQAGKFHHKMRQDCPCLGHLQDIAIAHKHQTVTFYTPEVSGCGTRGGDFDSDFSRDFEVTRLAYRTQEGEFTLLNTLQIVLAFYEDYFRRNNIQ